MPYLIDGHNLIPKIPGLSLEAADDEIQLITLLQDFCRQQRKNAEVFFDKAPPSQVRKQRFGRITAHFVRQDISADLAIQNRLTELAGEAQNWTVVSSDRAVQSSARRARAQVLSSEALAKQLRSSSSGQQFHARNSFAGEISEPVSSEEDIEEWLKLFGGQHNDGRKHPGKR